jgi:hypothetical protein
LKKKDYSIKKIKETIKELGLDVQDLDDIEILASKESELYKCEGTCVKCQSGCETNS